MKSNLAITYTLAILTAVGLDVYTQAVQLSPASYAIAGAVTLMCVLWHYKAAYPKFNANQDENFEKGLFVFSLNLLVMLAAFKMLRPMIECWYLEDRVLPLEERLEMSLLTVATGMVALLVGWFAMKATVFAAEIGPDKRKWAIDACSYSASMGAFVFMAPPGLEGWMLAAQPILAICWIALCFYVAIDDVNKFRQQFKSYLPVLAVFGAVLVVGFPARAHLNEHGSALKQMSTLEALDFMFAIVFWVIATVKIGGDMMMKQLYRILD